MPLLDSFKVDHTKMIAPCVRVAKMMTTPNLDKITVYDLRFCTPNKNRLKTKGLHTLEHLFAGFMRKYLNSSSVEIIDISPMGCQTGFYMSLIGFANLDLVKNAWLNSMREILNVNSQNEIPELNKFQCGSCELHSLYEAKEIAREILSKDIILVNTDDIKLNLEKING